MLIFNLTYRNNAVTKKWTLEEGDEKTLIFFSTSFPHFKFCENKSAFIIQLLF
jgi:hypothetical protein